MKHHPSKQLTFFVVVLALAALAAAPAAAQTIYLPFVDSVSENGLQTTTKVWVSNPGTEPRRFSTFFIESGVDGSEPRGDLPQIGVPPGQTRVLEIEDGEGKVGVLEITGSPQLRYEARVEVRDGNNQLVASTRVPFLDSNNLVEAEEVVQLLGLERRLTNSMTDIGLLNLSSEPAQCSIGFFRFNGSSIAPSALVQVPAVGLLYFEDAFAILGQEAIADARFEIECDRDSYVYGVLDQLGSTGDLVFVSPAAEGASALTAPGDEPPLPPGTELFLENGLFLDAEPGDSRAAFNIPLEPGVLYDRITVEFDFFFAGYNNQLFHTLTSLRGDGIFYVVTMRADRNRTILDTTANVGVGDTGPWLRGATYRVAITLDATTDQMIFQVRQGNAVRQTMTARLGRVLADFNGSGLTLDFSQDKVYDNAFFPLWGSRFSNLRVTLERPVD